MEPLQKTVNFKPKLDAVKQEVDRNEDMIRSALRAIASLNRTRFINFILNKFQVFISGIIMGTQNELNDIPSFVGS